MKKTDREIERKFLVLAPPPGWRRCPRSAIEQGYLVVAADGAEVRVRRIGRRHLLTVKRGRGRSRMESEIALSGAQFGALWLLTAGRRIEKTRYAIGDGRRTIELDIYRGRHRGLMVAEVEFPSEAAAAAYRPPAWMGREVTGEARYRNQNLALAERTDET